MSRVKHAAAESNAICLVSLTQTSLFVARRLPGNKISLSFAKNAPVRKPAQKNERAVNAALTASVYKLICEYESRSQKDRVHFAPIRAVTFFYAAPLSAFGAPRAAIAKTQPEVLSESMLAEALKHTAGDFLHEAAKQTETRAGTSGFKIIERRFLKAELDGYPVSSYLDRPFKQFSAFLLMGCVREHLAESLSDACHALTRGVQIEHRVLPLSIYDELQSSILSQEYSFCLMFPHESNLIRVENGIPALYRNIEYGTETFIGSLSRSLKMTKAVTRSYVDMYREKKLHEKDELRLQEALSKTARQLLDTFIPPKEAPAKPQRYHLPLYLGSVGDEHLHIPELLNDSRIKEADIPPLIEIGAEELQEIQTTGDDTLGPCEALLLASVFQQ